MNRPHAFVARRHSFAARLLPIFPREIGTGGVPRDRPERALRRHPGQRLRGGVPAGHVDGSQEDSSEERVRVFSQGPSEGSRHPPKRLWSGTCACIILGARGHLFFTTCYLGLLLFMLDLVEFQQRGNSRVRAAFTTRTRPEMFPVDIMVVCGTGPVRSIDRRPQPRP